MFVESWGLCGFDLPLHCVLGCLTFQSKHKNKQPRQRSLVLDGLYRPVCVQRHICVWHVCIRVIWFKRIFCFKLLLSWGFTVINFEESWDVLGFFRFLFGFFFHLNSCFTGYMWCFLESIMKSRIHFSSRCWMLPIANKIHLKIYWRKFYFQYILS